MRRRTLRKRRHQTRRRRQRGGNIDALVRSIAETCRTNAEGETFCIENADSVRDYYTKKGVTLEKRDMPESADGLSVIAVNMEIVETADPRFALVRHGFALVRDGSKWYRADSWQGIHPFVAKPIDIKTWLADWRQFTTRLEAGTFSRDDIVKLFGEWETEKEQLRKAGEWVNDYPKSRTGTFSMKRLDIQIA
jgi:hypothetical protein